MADNGQDPVVSGAQKVSKAANTARTAAKTAKTVGKAATKAAAQNYIGAAKDLLMDPEVLKAIISIILVVCFLLVFILMAVGAAIVAVLNYLLDKLREAVGDDIDIGALESGGNLFDFSVDSLGHIIVAIPEALGNIFVDICSSDEDGDGKKETDNSGDYQKTMNAAIDQEAFVGEDGAIRQRLNAIKNRVVERGNQIGNTLTNIESKALGLEIAAKLSNGLLYPCLFAGVEGEMEKIYDPSAFNLTDVQALKVLAAYCAQNECSPGEAEIWDLLNYIGWFDNTITNIEDELVSQENGLNTMKAEISFADSVLEFAAVGQDKLTFDLSRVSAERWFGTFKPQWWEEEWDQLLEYKNYYERCGSSVPGVAGNATGYDIADAIENHMLLNGDGLDKLGAVPDTGLIEYLFTVGMARLSVSAVTYEGTDAELRERMNALLNDVTNTLFDKSYYELVSGILNSWADWTSSLSNYGEEKVRTFPNAQVHFVYDKIEGQYEWTKAYISPKDTPAGTYCIVEMSTDETRNKSLYSSNGQYAPHLVAQAQSAFYSGDSPIRQHGVVHNGATQVPEDDFSWNIGDPDLHYITDPTTGERIYDGTYWVIYYCPCFEVGGYATGGNACVCGQASLHNTNDCPDGYTCTEYHDVCGVCHKPCDKGLQEIKETGKYGADVTLGSMGDINAWHSNSCFVGGHAATDPDEIEKSIERFGNTEYAAKECHQWEMYAIVNVATPDLSQEGVAPPEKLEAYKLKLTLEVAFSPVSVDYLAKNIIGLWPGDLDAVDEAISSNGKTEVYAANHIGNESLRKYWTETISVNPDGSRHQLTLNFERKNGYQYEYYVDYIKSIAAEMGISTDGLFAPTTKWGDHIAEIAEKEYAYNQTNMLYGGDRYWGLCSAGQTAGMSTANRQPIDGWRKANSWTTAFVLACAFQASETGIHGGFGNLNKYGIITDPVSNKAEEWPILPREFCDALKNAPDAKKHTENSYTPIPGDIVIFDTKAGNDLTLNTAWRVGIVTEQSGATFTAIIGDVGNQVYKYTGNYAIGSAATLDGSSLEVIEYWTPKYTTTLFTNPTFLNMEIYDTVLESSPVVYAKVLVTPPATEYLQPKYTYLFGYPRFRWSQIPAVLEVLESRYPQTYTAQLRAAVDANDPAWAVTEWGKLFSGTLSSNAKELQIEIWQELYFKPFISSFAGQKNKFNWGATRMRQDILMALLSTTDNHNALKSALMSVVETLSNDISDAELLAVLTTDDALRNALSKNAHFIWAADKEWIHEEWLACIRCVLNTLVQQNSLTVAGTP